MLKVNQERSLFLFPKKGRNVEIFTIDDRRIRLRKPALLRSTYRLELKHFLLCASLLTRLCRFSRIELLRRQGRWSARRQRRPAFG